jgi:hypothetical protein
MAVGAVWSEPLSNSISQVTGNNTGISLSFGLDAVSGKPSTALNSGHLSQLDLDQAPHGTGIYSSRIRELHFPVAG